VTYEEDLALCEGMRGGPKRRHTYKRISANGATRLFSFIRGQWVLVAKRAPGAMWSGAPGLAARLRLAEGLA
jgi:hypothetical protein